MAVVEHSRTDPATEAAASLYERYHVPVYRYCLNRLRSREEAEDAAQTTFMYAFRALQKGFRPDVEAAWLYKIAHNVVVNRAVSAKRRGRVELPSDLQLVQDELAAPSGDGHDELIPLRDALAEMPDRLRTALLLREWKGLSYAEVAEEMDVSVSAVETLIFRARRHLAQALTEPARKLKKAFDGLGLLPALKALLAGGSAAKGVAVAATAVAGAAALVTAVPQSGSPAVEPVRATPVLAGVGLTARDDARAEPRRVVSPAERPRARGAIKPATSSAGVSASRPTGTRPEQEPQPQGTQPAQRSETSAPKTSARQEAKPAAPPAPKDPVEEVTDAVSPPALPPPPVTAPTPPPVDVPALPPVEVTPPPVEVTPPQLPLEPPELPAPPLPELPTTPTVPLP